VDRPTLKIEIGFGADPLGALSTVSWTDVTDYLFAQDAPITIRRGRATERDQIEAGRLTLTLRDPDRRFDPTYELGAYYPYVRPRARIRVSAKYPSGSMIWRELFTGYVESWEPGYGHYVSIAVVRIRAVDAFALLNRRMATLTISIGGTETANNAIGNVLNVIGWPTADRDLSTSATQLPQTTFTNQSALSIMQAIALADNGTLFIDGEGDVVFHDQDWRANNTTVQFIFGDESDRTTVWTLGDSTLSVLGRTTMPRPVGWVAGNYTEEPFLTMQMAMDDRAIRNDIRVTRVGGAEQVASDTASQALYDVLSYSLTNILLKTDGEALTRAEYLLGRYKDPQWRVNQLVANGELHPNGLWTDLMARDIDDLGQVVKRMPPGNTGAMTIYCRVESVAHNIGVHTWLTTYQFSPEDPTLLP
jgi:hypothetical protein